MIDYAATIGPSKDYRGLHMLILYVTWGFWSRLEWRRRLGVGKDSATIYRPNLTCQFSVQQSHNVDDNNNSKNPGHEITHSLLGKY